MKERGKGMRERKKRISPKETKECLWRERADVAHRKTEIYIGTRETLC